MVRFSNQDKQVLHTRCPTWTDQKGVLPQKLSRSMVDQIPRLLTIKGRSPDLLVVKHDQRYHRGVALTSENFMANTYTQLYIQFVFSICGRQNLIRESFRNELEKIMCGIVTNQKCKLYAIYCNPDHTHLFIGMHPSISPSKLMEQVKSGSSKWLNEKKHIVGKFSLQNGFGAFTYSKSHIDQVVKYVLNQPVHHKNQSFREEYMLLLEKFEIEYIPKYLFEWYD